MEFGHNLTYANTDIVVNDTDLDHSYFGRRDHVLALPAVREVVRGKAFPAVLGSFSGSMMLPARCHDEPRQGPLWHSGWRTPTEVVNEVPLSTNQVLSHILNKMCS